ncbi:hypothetical protein TNCV_1384631 [Trichonephila clavipes]|nr:hypothetical protein TNCV_1384631 [Trichonephila clavipes]
MFSLKSELKSGQIVVTCMVLKATGNDSRHLALCNEELRRSQSGLCRLDDISNNSMPLRHGGTLNSHRAASPLVWLVEGVGGPWTPPGFFPLNWGGIEQTRTVTYMVLKDKANDRTTDKRCGRSIVHLKKESNRSVFSPEEPENTKKELQTDSHQRGYVTGETPIDNNNIKPGRDWGDDILSSWLFGSRDRSDMWCHLLWSRGV